MPLSDHLSDHHCDVFVRRLTLSRFRNYEQARLDVSHSAGRPVVLIGPNGAGKTNLLEALSLLSPGRGLRRAARADFPHFHSAPASRQSEQSAEIMPSPPVWAVSAEFETPLGPLQASTGILPDKPDGARVFRLNGDKSSAGQIASHLALSWLTPQMDGLFIGSPSARRRFIDRLVIAFDPAHSARLSRYEKCYRERQKLLTSEGDAGWIQATECQLAEIGVAIMAARASLVRALSESTYQGDEAFGFPRVHMAMRGGGSQWLDHEPAAIVEDKICQDAAARRLRGDGAMMGPHAQDLDTLHLAKNQPASLASTGEQKSLMIAAILAHARLQDRRLSRPPLLLLDDVAAHLDEAKRACLFAATSELKGQIWYSGTDAHAFTKLQNFAHFLTVVDGKIS